MTEEKTQNNTATTIATPNAVSTNKPPFSRGGGSDFKKNKRSPRKGRDNVRSEFDQKILDIRRVTRVSSGGRRFSFSVAMVIGDKKGKVGIGVGKAGDTSLAIEKAVKNAKKDMFTLPLNDNGSIVHSVDAKFSSACVSLKPAPGRGIIAGSALKDVADLVGIKHLNGKILSGSKNKLNIAKATVKALSMLQKARVKEVKVKSK